MQRQPGTLLGAPCRALAALLTRPLRCSFTLPLPAPLRSAMEYAAGGDMFEYVVRKGGLRESEARWFFQQLIVAVDYIHRMVRGGCTAPDGCSSRALLSGSAAALCAAALATRLLPTPPAPAAARCHSSATAAAAVVAAAADVPPVPRRCPCTPRLQGVANRDIKLENTLLDGSPRPLIKVRPPPLPRHGWGLQGWRPAGGAAPRGGGRSCTPPCLPRHVLPPHPCLLSPNRSHSPNTPPHSRPPDLRLRLLQARKVPERAGQPRGHARLPGARGHHDN